MTELNQIRQTENQSGVPQGHTGSARYAAERNERKPVVSWAALLDEAVKKPGFIHEAYFLDGKLANAMHRNCSQQEKLLTL